jgi:large subunit ribosomal protein L3
VRTEERDGYRAVQLGFGRKKPRRSRKPDMGHAASAGLDYVPAITREFRLGEDDVLAAKPHEPPRMEASEKSEGESEQEETAVAGMEQEGLRIGQLLTVGMFESGDRVKVTGRSKGRGFQGVIKRHGFRGRPKTHGHPSIRVAGSIGPGTDPSRVIKGRKMAGQMGVERQTIRNLRVVKVDPERNLLFVRGSVPGARNGWVFVSKQ